MELSFLFLGQPLWMWAVFLTLVLVLLALDLGVLNRGRQEIGVRRSLLLSAFYIAIGLGFGGFVWAQMGAGAAVEYWTGFVVEKSLAMDNIFVIATIFGAFAVPRHLQHRVLFWGILGVIVLRAVMIGFGAALVQRYDWVLLVFAAFLIVTGARMLLGGGDHAPGATGATGGRMLRWLRRNLRVTDDFVGHRFVVRQPDDSGRLRLFVTPLFLALVAIEFADVVFAVDSVPAIFAITTDPYLVYTSNIFAILGLRALYFALAAVLHRFWALKPALAVLLIFIGGKVVVAEALGIEKIPAALSLGVTFAILAVGVALSLARQAPARQ
ncbi:TerC/Alx family metal homeostasis membrane protein [Paracoccus alkenifer]|uniref:Tellurite resistance protein TerC n=1 Tax=Paracoccus alkenifer TaxID=65735 RepID=A0A1H6JPV3_9RHOB|nr:TerC/Alx family metal homeostasis membrane protein [Paracoccus alkenifer]SEH62918.1 tellurite resistance protein TerC [Paracoccus alkenifer]